MVGCMHYQDVHGQIIIHLKSVHSWTPHRDGREYERGSPSSGTWNSITASQGKCTARIARAVKSVRTQACVHAASAPPLQGSKLAGDLEAQARPAKRGLDFAISSSGSGRSQRAPSTNARPFSANKRQAGTYLRSKRTAGRRATAPPRNTSCPVAVTHRPCTKSPFCAPATGGRWFTNFVRVDQGSELV